MGQTLIYLCPLSWQMMEESIEQRLQAAAPLTALASLHLEILWFIVMHCKIQKLSAMPCRTILLLSREKDLSHYTPKHQNANNNKRGLRVAARPPKPPSVYRFQGLRGRWAGVDSGTLQGPPRFGLLVKLPLPRPWSSRRVFSFSSHRSKREAGAEP